MINRRNFILGSTITSITAFLGLKEPVTAKSSNVTTEIKPIVISTWNHGLPANEAAWKIIKSGGKAIDAVETGAKVPEADPEANSVGYGGYPDRDGNVTLDACIMDETGNCGSVSYLQHIKHPISVARKVMDDTPHVMLSGAGALEFALQKGFKKEELLTDKSKAAWKKWLEKSEYSPIINRENHDTIGLLAIDQKGDISGACTTSGLAWKLHGRVGDSPIIGAGMFTDNDIGGAVATGMGEAVMKTLGTFLIVELMRGGMTPQEACEEAVGRIAAKQDYKSFQIGYLAINKAGEYGAYSIQKGFNYALHKNGDNQMHKANYLNK
ncbi:MAG: glycosylasparaginase [Bacteroidetes bacterium]|nr:MAG: glycosylasparaginase [Bacteroidota bacterium]